VFIVVEGTYLLLVFEFWSFIGWLLFCVHLLMRSFGWEQWEHDSSRENRNNISSNPRTG
jgi:hypothetical protein